MFKNEIINLARKLKLLVRVKRNVAYRLIYSERPAAPIKWPHLSLLEESIALIDISVHCCNGTIGGSKILDGRHSQSIKKMLFY